MPKLLPRMSIFIVLLMLLSTAPSILSAAESVNTEEWDITADKITRYEEPQSIIAEGNIVLIKRKKMPSAPPPATDKKLTEWSALLEEEPLAVKATPADLVEEGEPTYKTQVTIKADWAAYDIALSTIKARGNVSVVGDGEQLFADEAEVNLEQETGSFKNARVIRAEHDMHLEGAVIEKTGFKTYHIQNGWIVTCKVEAGQAAPWSFAASNAYVEQDGYATLTNARFRIKDVPVLYAPWLIMPVKNKRQTGFLIPELSTSQNNGFGFNIPFFWNISDSVDVTLHTQYMVNRGYMPGIEARYVKNAGDRGAFLANYLSDELSDPSETGYYQDTGFTHDNKDRYWIRAKADHDFGNDWTSRLDIDIVSDHDYLTEFNAGLTGFQESNDQLLSAFGRSLENKYDDQRTNTFGLLKSWGSSALTGQLLAINDVRADQSGPSPLWQLPSLGYTGTQPLESFGNFTLQWDTGYDNFWREEGIGGHRVDIYPTLSAPLPISPYLESRAQAGVRETFYVPEGYGDEEWDGDASENRFLYDLHAEVGTTLMRTFGISAAQGNGFNHQIRPYVDYDFIPDVDQSDLPIYDGKDRIEQRNDITYGIDNFFDVLHNDSISSHYGTLKFSQSYSLLDERSDNPFSDITMKLRWNPLDTAYFDYRTNYSVYGDGFVRHDIDSYYSNSRGDYLGLQYINDIRSNVEQINGQIRATLIAGWLAKLRVEHSISHDETNEADIGIVYQAPCWSVELMTQYTPSDTTFLVVFNLANIGSPFAFNY